MSASNKIDAARIELMLGELRLPGIKMIWAALAATADKEGWPAARVSPERSCSRILCNSGRSHLPPDAASSSSLVNPASLSARIWGALSWVSDLEIRA